MSELKSIHLAIELAVQQRDKCAKGVANARRTLGFTQDQMGQLQGYASDTDARLLDSGSAGLSTEMIRHHYQFMDRLQQAIAMQTGVIANANRQLELASRDLVQAELRLAGLNQVLKNRQAELQLKLRKREQRVTDEFASMQYARARAQSIGEIR